MSISSSLLLVPRHYFHSRKDFLDLLWMLSRTFWHACSLDRKRTRTGIKIISINHSRIHSAQQPKNLVGSKRMALIQHGFFCMFIERFTCVTIGTIVRMQNVIIQYPILPYYRLSAVALVKIFKMYDFIKGAFFLGNCKVNRNPSPPVAIEN